MINPLRVFFRNIVPATFENALTYLEQLQVLKDKTNEVIDVVNAGGFEFETGNGLRVDEGVLSAKVDGETIKFKPDGTMYSEGGGGGSSDDLWRPTVDAAGNISWEKSTSDTPPATQNIKGPAGQNGENGQNGQDGQDGVSPIATVTQTAAGATITITDAQGTTSANIFNGAAGAPGQDGVGVPSGGTTGQVLAKKTNSDYDTEWVNAGGGGGEPAAYIKSASVSNDGNTLTLTDKSDNQTTFTPQHEPSAFLKDASVSGNTLTLTKQDNTTVAFTPSGGGGSATPIIAESTAHSSTITIDESGNGDYETIEEAINNARTSQELNLSLVNSATITSAYIDGTGLQDIFITCTQTSKTITTLIIKNCNNIRIDFSKIRVANLYMYNSNLFTNDEVVNVGFQDMVSLKMYNSKLINNGNVDTTSNITLWTQGCEILNSSYIDRSGSVYTYYPQFASAVIKDSHILTGKGNFTIGGGEYENTVFELFNSGTAGAEYPTLTVQKDGVVYPTFKGCTIITPTYSYGLSLTNATFINCSISTKISQVASSYDGVLIGFNTCTFINCKIHIYKINFGRNSIFTGCHLVGEWYMEGGNSDYSTGNKMIGCYVFAMVSTTGNAYSYFWERLEIKGCQVYIGATSYINGITKLLSTVNGTYSA